MAIGKPRKPGGSYEVYVYNRHVGRKVYVGSRKKYADAKTLERNKEKEFADSGPPVDEEWTYQRYGDYWLEHHHGEGTKRPARTTHATNKGYLNAFLEEHGDRPLDSIERDEALAYSKTHPYHAWTISAMLNDALDEEKCKSNPFANRRQQKKKGRKRIIPVTEYEVSKLGGIALSVWGDHYGRTVKAAIDWQAGVGTRPAEAWPVEWSHIDFDKGEAAVTRCKPPYDEDIVVVADWVMESLGEIPGEHTGHVFKAPRGNSFVRGNFWYYWNPVRDAFKVWLEGEDPDRARRLFTQGRDPNKVPNLDLYELRHHVGSVMAERGRNEFEIAEQLGNSPEVCREYYIHPFTDRVRERNRAALNRVVDLDEHRKKRSA